MEPDASSSGLQVIAHTHAAVELLRYRTLVEVTQPTAVVPADIGFP